MTLKGRFQLKSFYDSKKARCQKRCIFQGSSLRSHLSLSFGSFFQHLQGNINGIFHRDRAGGFISISTKSISNTSSQLESVHNQEPKAFRLLLNALYLYICMHVIKTLGRREIQEELVCFRD